jgi:hypothetical protein
MTIKKVLARFAILIGIGIGVFPLICWINHPELTQMQIFLKYWWHLIVMVPMVAWGLHTLFGND